MPDVKKIEIDFMTALEKVSEKASEAYFINFCQDLNICSTPI